MRRKAEGNTEKGSLPAAQEGRKRIYGARPRGVWLKKKEPQKLDVTKLPFVYQNTPAVADSCSFPSYATVAGSFSQRFFPRLFPTRRLTFSVMLSICRFCLSISLPMSTAMDLRLPMMLPTAPRFSSISSSRASLVILRTRSEALTRSFNAPAHPFEPSTHLLM